MKDLQLYYGRTIRSDKGQLANMKRAIRAVYYHRTSTDEEPLCTPGPNTWCKGNRQDVADYEHKPIPAAIAEQMKPVFEDLTKDELLLRCLKGSTSNVNEAFNNVL
jgi:hypothetical protein